ncbi:MAG: NADH-quinone oxidoreductase subunit A [Crocinitomicaceae bacterium]
MPGLIEMAVFIAVLFAGFIYIVKKGALKWE